MNDYYVVGYRGDNDRYFPLLPFVAGLALSPFLFGGFGPNIYYSPYYGPSFGPHFGPSFGPHYGPYYRPYYR